MMQTLIERTQILSRKLSWRSDPPLLSTDRVEEEFRGAGKERSITGLLVAGLCSLTVALVALFCVSSYLGAKALFATDETGLELGDVRIGSDYREFVATDWALSDERNLAVATRGGGLQRCRTDGWPLGFWETFDPISTGGLLADASLKQVLCDGKRLWMTGENNSLSSCDLDYGDWHRVFGGRGFHPKLDFSRDLTCLAISPEQRMFFAGTDRFGLGAYDVDTREWLALNQYNGRLASGRVSALAFSFPLLFVGGPKGLQVFRVFRKNGRLGVESEQDFALPKPYAEKPVAALFVDEPANERSLHCLVGHGAHLVFNMDKTDWRVVVDDGDQGLYSLNGEFSAVGALPLENGAIFAIPGEGIARYDCSQRRLALENEGLPSLGGKVEPVALQRAGPGRSGKILWAVCQKNREKYSSLFKKEKGWFDWDGNSEWVQVGPDEYGIRGLALVGESPALLMESGNVKIHPSDPTAESTGTILFDPIAFKKLGASELFQGSLFVARGDQGPGNETISRYVKEIGGWMPVVSDSPELFSVLRAGTGSLWAVRENGEAGRFEPVGERYGKLEYVPVFGKSDLSAGEGTIVSAESFQPGFWFVRRDATSVAPYAYDTATRRIVKHAEGICGDFEPSRIRAVGDHLYMLGKIGNQRCAYYRSARSSSDPWQRLQPEKTNIVQMAVSPSKAGLLDEQGRVTIHSSPEHRDICFSGQGASIWQKLMPDRFGRIWGLAENGEVHCYDSRRGNWIKLDGPELPATDMSIAETGNDSDTVLFGTSNGLNVLEVGKEDAFAWKAPSLEKLEILRLESRYPDLLAISRDGPGRISIWRCDDALKGAWTQMFEASPDGVAPGEDDWRGALWASFAHDELWWVSRAGDIWRYGLEKPFWTKWSPVDGFPGKVRLAPDGSLWYLAKDGTLHKTKPTLRQHEIVSGFPECRASWQWICHGLKDITRLFLWGGVSVLAATCFLFACIWTFCFFYGRLDGGGVLLFRGTVFALALFSTALLFHCARWSADRWAVEPFRPFIRADFRESVLDFSIGPRHLEIVTKNGSFSFSLANDGFSIAPEQFFPRATTFQTVAGSGTYAERHRNGPWELRQNQGGGYRLFRTSSSGKNLERHFLPGKCASTRNLFDAFAIDDRIFATTPLGVAVYRFPGNERLESLIPYPGGPAPKPTQFDDALYSEGKEGQRWRLENSDQGPRWTETVLPRPVLCGAYGIVWNRTPSGDDFPPSVFCEDLKRFCRDVALELETAANGSLWVKTLAGWRAIVSRDSGSSIGAPSSTEPKPALQVRSWKIDRSWSCTRHSSGNHADSSDIVTLRFKAGDFRCDWNDPFAERGRFPDQDARSVLPARDGAWIVTALGLSKKSASGDWEMQLPGRRIDALLWRGAEILCLTDKGVFSRNPSSKQSVWKEAAPVDPALFFADRIMRIDLGENISIRATEQSSGRLPETILENFDVSEGRFSHDAVRQIAGKTDGFWAVTSAGLQYRRWKDGKMAGFAAFPMCESVKGMGKDNSGELYAFADGKNVWRLREDRSWEKLAETDRSDPFRSPETTELSSLIRLQRTLGPDGSEEFHLFADRVPVVFADGKLSCDYATGAAGEKYQATRAGLRISGSGRKEEKTTRLVAWPHGTPDVGPSEIFLENGAVACRLEDGTTLGLSAEPRAWEMIRHPEPRNPVVRYDGERWNFDLDGEQLPRVVYQIRTMGTILSKLNDLGQFPFDAVQRVEQRKGRLFILHQAGVSVRPVARRIEIPFQTAQAGDMLPLSDIAGQRRDRWFENVRATGEDVLATEKIGRRIWVLTSHGIKCLKTSMIDDRIASMRFSKMADKLGGSE